VLGAALLTVLLAGGCARPAERAATAATTAPSPSTSTPAIDPTATMEDVEALERMHVELQRFCRTEFPDHCAGVVLFLGPPGAQPVSGVPAERAWKPSKQELALLRQVREQMLGKISRKELAELKRLFDQSPPLSPEELPLVDELTAPGLVWMMNQVVVFRRPLAALDAAVRQRFPSLTDLRFADARYSFRYLEALGKRIRTEQAGKGIRIQQVRPEPDGSGVLVVTPDARRVRRQLRQRYGPAVIVEAPPAP
jgi:hypothetical protein